MYFKIRIACQFHPHTQTIPHLRSTNPSCQLARGARNIFKLLRLSEGKTREKISDMERNIKCVASQHECYGIVLQIVQGRILALLSPLLFLVLLATIKSNYSCLPEIAPIQLNREAVKTSPLRVKSQIVGG